MKTLSKNLVATIAAGAVAVSTSSPAFARGHNGDGIGAGEVIAGALILGGIAAVAASAGGNNRDRSYGDYRDGNSYRYDRAGYGDYERGGHHGRHGYDGGNPRQAIERCVRQAEHEASRYSHGRADVTDVRDIRRTDWGYEVRGRIAVNASGRGWRHGEANYGRGWGGDYRGWNASHRGYDSGSFKCRIERGRVTDIDFSGIRGL